MEGQLGSTGQKKAPPEDNFYKWRARVDHDFVSIREQLRRQVEELRQNTLAMKRLNDEFLALREDTKPVVDALDSMEAGIRVLGRIGRLGEKFGRSILVLIAIGVVVKFVFGGASWSDVSNAFYRVIGR